MSSPLSGFGTRGGVFGRATADEQRWLRGLVVTEKGKRWRGWLTRRLALWRGLGGRPWDADDRILAAHLDHVASGKMQNAARALP